MAKKSVYQMQQEAHLEVASQIRALMMEHGTQWLKSWSGKAGLTPTNALTQQTYQGFNWVRLNLAATAKGYASNYWATYAQWLELGFQVQAGEKSVGGFRVIHGVKDKDTDKERHYTSTKPFNVFNADQVADADGNRPAFAKPVEVTNIPTVADDFVKDCGAILKNIKTDRAFYVPSQDFINMPHCDQFNTVEDYQATLLHELTHWSGHHSRLDRKFGTSFGTKDYAQEELVAELGAAMLCSQLEISVTPREDHAKYLNNWMQKLKDEPSAFFKAATAASTAATFLTDLAGQTSRDETIAA